MLKVVTHTQGSFNRSLLASAWASLPPEATNLITDKQPLVQGAVDKRAAMFDGQLCAAMSG